MRAVFAKNPKRYKLAGSNRTLDRGAAHEIRIELLRKERAAAMHHDLREALDAINAGQPVKKKETKAIGCSIP